MRYQQLTDRQDREIAARDEPRRAGAARTADGPVNG